MEGLHGRAGSKRVNRLKGDLTGLMQGREGRLGTGPSGVGLSAVVMDMEQLRTFFVVMYLKKAGRGGLVWVEGEKGRL